MRKGRSDDEMITLSVVLFSLLIAGIVLFAVLAGRLLMAALAVIIGFLVLKFAWKLGKAAFLIAAILILLMVLF